MLDYWITLSKKVAARYARLHTHKAQDIYSAALEGLVIGLDESGKKEIPEGELEYFLYSRIKFTIQDFISSDHLIPIPRRSRRRHDIPLMEIRPILDSEEVDGMCSLSERMPGFTIEDFPLDLEEKTLIEMLMEGYSKNEIAERMETTRRAVYGSLDKIRIKMKRWCHAMQVSY